jgi:hypothetical protein
MTAGPATAPATATVAAWRAASAFAVALILVSFLAEADPATAVSLALICADPWLLATALIMTELGQGRETKDMT